MAGKNVWLCTLLALVLGVSWSQISKKPVSPQPAKVGGRLYQEPVEVRYQGQPANRFYFQTAEGIVGPFTLTPIPLPKGVYSQPTRVAVPATADSPCGTGQWAMSESHLYLCGDNAGGKTRWRRLAFEKGGW